jgi:DNA repair and recombination protein RAD52
MVDEFSKRERDRMSQQLDKSLGQEFLSVRTGFGNTKLTYVEGWRIIGLANKIFGFDGWSSEIKSFKEEYNIDIDNKISVGYSCICRVILKNGIYKEDIGFGSSDNQKMRGLAIEKAKKEACTDALKRALRQFGNALGNCCYNKEYISDIQLNKLGRKNGLIKANKMLRKEDFITRNEDEVSFSQEPDISDT